MGKNDSISEKKKIGGDQEYLIISALSSFEDKSILGDEIGRVDYKKDIEIQEIAYSKEAESFFLGKQKPKHPSETRHFITKTLLFSIIGMAAIPTLVYLIFPNLFHENLLEFSKWTIQILSPLLGTAIGFYFGSMNGKLK